jgi:hypothetical protein
LPNIFDRTATYEPDSCCQQGDPIGRIFARCALDYFVQFFFNYGSNHTFWAIFFHGKSYVLVLTKVDKATFFAIFSQTHLVTLVVKNFWGSKTCCRLRGTPWRTSLAAWSATTATPSRPTSRNQCYKSSFDRDRLIYLLGQIELCFVFWVV